MKKLLTTTLLALASVAFLATSAEAQTVTANLGDVILGFRATGGTGATQNLEVDLGSVSQFYNAIPGSTITLGELSSADLASIYGANWASRSDLLFGLVGTTGPIAGSPDGHAPKETNWVSDPELTPGTLAQPEKRLSGGSNSGGESQIDALQENLSGAASTANSAESSNYSVNLAGSYTSTDLFKTGVSFNEYSILIDNTVNNIGAGTAAISDFYELKPGTVPFTAPGTLLGKFELFQNGPLEFVATSPVPEPSSIGLMGVGFLSLIGMVVLRRRRSVVA